MTRMIARYPTSDQSEPDPFKPATDVSQCTHCGAQISVRQIKFYINFISLFIFALKLIIYIWFRAPVERRDPRCVIAVLTTVR